VDGVLNLLFIKMALEDLIVLENLLTPTNLPLVINLGHVLKTFRTLLVLDMFARKTITHVSPREFQMEEFLLPNVKQAVSRPLMIVTPLLISVTKLLLVMVVIYLVVKQDVRKQLLVKVLDILPDKQPELQEPPEEIRDIPVTPLP